MEGLRLLLTGASRGLGRALALSFAERGVRLVLTGRTEGALAEVAEEIVSRGFLQPVVVALDLRAGERKKREGRGERGKEDEGGEGDEGDEGDDGEDISDSDLLGGMISRRLGGLEGVILNAGLLGELSPVVHGDEGMWREVFDVNVFANRRLLSGLHRLLVLSRGFVVGVTCGEHRGSAYWGCYGASKAALEVMLGSYGREVDRFGIGVEVWDPGRMSTGLRCLAYPGEGLGEGGCERYPIEEGTLGGCVEIVERWARERKWGVA